MTSSQNWLLRAGGLFLLLLAAPLAAQDQNLGPDGEDGPVLWFLTDGGTTCNTAACDAEVNELASAPDDAEVNTATNNGVILFDFPTPSADPDSGTDAQTFQVISDRCNASGSVQSGGTDPNFDLELWCNGSKIGADLVTGQVISDVTNQSNSFTWTLTGGCASNGSDVQVLWQNHQAGGGGNRRHSCIDVIEWEVTHASASNEFMLID